MDDALPIFDFETDFAGTLRCIPMIVRFKLDLCGIKLSLRQWSRFTRDDRAALVRQACDSRGEVDAYRAHLVDLILARSGELAAALDIDADPEWADLACVPPRIAAFAAAAGVAAPSPRMWSQLPPLARFTLCKLTRPGHDNDNFLPAMHEFGLLG